MAINRYRVYVGPLGNLRALPPFTPGAAPTVTPIVLGGLHVALSGRVVRDRLKTKQRWDLRWERLKEKDLAVIEAFHQRTMKGPYYLIDGRRTNILAPDIAATGNAFRNTTSFAASAGTLALALAGTARPSALAGLLDSHLTWTGVANGNTLKASVTNSSPLFLYPVLSGSTYTFSAWIAGGTTARLSIWPYDSALAVQPVVQSSNLVLTAGYQRFNFVYTPGVNDVAFQVGLTATGSGNIQTMAWQVEMDQAVTDWTFGFGAPEVVLADSPERGYPIYPWHNYTLSLLEA